MSSAIITISFPEIEKQLERIADACEIIAAAVVGDGNHEDIVTTPQIAWQARSQEMKKMVGTFTFTPVVEDEGVAERKFSIQVNGSTEVDKIYPPEAIQSDEVKLPVGATVHAELVDADDSGNESGAAVADFTVTDTIAPSTPGQFGFAATSEVDE